MTLTLQKCDLHSLTHDRLLGSPDQHHVIPVAWQKLWIPTTAPYPGTDPGGRGLLWDARTATLAPTCHRNTHFWIVQLMKALESLGFSAAPADAHSALSKRFGASFTGTKEAPLAMEALTRFTEEDSGAGGNLHALIARKEYGQS